MGGLTGTGAGGGGGGGGAPVTAILTVANEPLSAVMVIVTVGGGVRHGPDRCGRIGSDHLRPLGVSRRV